MFQFTIRELVLLTLVVAMGVGWWLDRSSLTSQLKANGIWKLRANLLADQLDQRGWAVTWDDKYVQLEHKESGGTERVHAGNYSP